MRVPAIGVILAGLLSCGRAPAPDSGLLPYRDPGLSIDRRVDDLLARMTAEEKFRQLFMAPGGLDQVAESCKDGIFGLQIRSEQEPEASGTDPVIPRRRPVRAPPETLFESFHRVTARSADAIGPKS